MGTRTSIVINGRSYDTVSGMPLDEAPRVTRVEVHGHNDTHKAAVARKTAKHHSAKLQHSTTLRRDIVAKPHGARDKAATPQRTHAHIAKSPAIHKFAPHPTSKTPAPHVATHSHVVTAIHQKHAAQHAKPATPAMSSRELKDHLIATKLAEAKPHVQKKQRKVPLHRPARVSSVMAACFAIMLLGGYLSYINMPHLSVRVASTQTGVNASFPTYTPNGYSFDGPVSYSDGEVTLAFAANGGPHTYQIKQKRSTWDSQAVLDNLVAAQSSDYDTTVSGGLTIYTYGSNAAWVNAGTLYTITGNAPMGPDQVIKIAQSL